MSHQNLDFAAILRRRGYRMTPQRQMVLDAVCEIGGHATPEQVIDRVQRKSDAVNRATVYRTLEFLSDIGLVTTTATRGSHLTYEIAGPERHHHLVCQQCGADQEFVDDMLKPLLAAVESQYGFTVNLATHLTLFGLCESCRPKQD